MLSESREAILTSQTILASLGNICDHYEFVYRVLVSMILALGIHFNCRHHMTVSCLLWPILISCAYCTSKGFLISRDPLGEKVTQVVDADYATAVVVN